MFYVKSSLHDSRAMIVFLQLSDRSGSSEEQRYLVPNLCDKEKWQVSDKPSCATKYFKERDGHGRAVGSFGVQA